MTNNLIIKYLFYSPFYAKMQNLCQFLLSQCEDFTFSFSCTMVNIWSTVVRQKEKKIPQSFDSHFSVLILC